MSDRFDHTLEHKLETKPNEAETAHAAVRRIELITGTGRRRPWSSDDKIAIIVESLVPGANVSAVARRHGLSPQQLFGWRREARALFCDVTGMTAGQAPTETGQTRPHAHDRATAPGSMTRPPMPAFAPVVMVAPDRGPSSAPPPSAPPPAGDRTDAGVIEIVIGAVVVRVGARVDAERLAAVLAAVRRVS